MYKLYLNVSEYFGENLVLWHSEHWVVVVGMRAHVNDPIHVQVEIVKLWYLH